MVLVANIERKVKQAVSNWPESIKVTSEIKGEIGEIIMYVEQQRERQEVVPTYGRKPEPSCIMNGEAYNLTECQLVPTVTGDSGWIELFDRTVREIVLGYVRHGKRFG